MSMTDSENISEEIRKEEMCEKIKKDWNGFKEKILIKHKQFQQEVCLDHLREQCESLIKKCKLIKSKMELIESIEKSK